MFGLRDEAAVCGSGLENGAVMVRGKERRDLVVDVPATGRFAKDGDVGWRAAEWGNVLVGPIDGKVLMFDC